ncbi:HopJ type III effector protein [Flavobacterium sp.]|uniref:HopJ type III effector protein n=1 Tax=Flavobacterium sp. TaxID=239 RepID=UPI0038FC6110
MELKDFIEKLNESAENITFEETIAVIEQNYIFTPIAFQNGSQYNNIGENSGSCKLFAFGLLQKLSAIQMLSCFGSYYFEEVLGNPEGTNHQNIRNFIKTGWNEIRFEGVPLVLK